MLLAALALTACAGSASGPEAAPTGDNTVVWRTAGGDEISFPPDVQAWCGPASVLGSTARSVHVLVGEPTPRTPPQWFVIASLGDVNEGTPIAFPTDDTFVAGPLAIVFAVAESNEVSSAEDSTGSLTVQSVKCGVGGEVLLDLDGMLGSELEDGEAFTVKGTLRTEMTGPPEGWGDLTSDE
jgi:hypothetical protein